MLQFARTCSVPFPASSTSRLALNHRLGNSFQTCFFSMCSQTARPQKKGESNNYKANTIKDIYLSQNLPSNRLLWPRYPTAIHTRSARPGTPPVAPLGESGNLRTGPPPRWLDTPSLGVIHGRWVWKIGAQPVMAGGWCMDGPEETDAAAW